MPDFPFEGWVLRKCLKPERQTFIRGFMNRGETHAYYITSGERSFLAERVFSSWDAAIDAAFAELQQQQNRIYVQQANLDERVTALSNYYQKEKVNHAEV